MTAYDLRISGWSSDVCSSDLPTGQHLAVDSIHAVYAQARGDVAGDIVLSGPGAFSVEIGGRTEAEAKWIGTIDTIGLVLLLLLAFRSWNIPVPGVQTLAHAGPAGPAAVALLFDGTNAIGTTPVRIPVTKANLVCP